MSCTPFHVCLFLLLTVSLACPALASAPALWREGEDFVLATDKTRDNVNDKAPASGGKCLFGPSLDREGNVVEYRIALDAPVPAAGVIFRYARLHWRETMVPAPMRLELIGPGDPIGRDIAFADTRGWGNKPAEWGLLTVQVGDLAAGDYTVRLTSLADNNSINLDGFFVAGRGFEVTAEELAAQLRVAISARGYLGLQVPSAAVDQKALPALPVAARAFDGPGAPVTATLRDAAGGTIQLTPFIKLSKDGAIQCALPSLKDGTYTLTLASDLVDQAVRVELSLLGDFLASLDDRIARLVAFNAALADMDTPGAVQCRADFAHAVQFVRDGRAAMSQSISQSENLRRQHLAQAEGRSDPAPLAVNIAATLAQFEQTAQRLQQGKAPYAERTGVFRRAYVSKGSGNLLVYRSYVPTSYPTARSMPLILMLHGGGGDENYFADMENGAILRGLEQRGYMMVAPRYNRREQPTLNEDLLQLIDLTCEQYPKIDRSRIYVTGISMGGGTTYRMATGNPDLFAAACCVSGTGDTAVAEKLATTPLLILHGGADTVSSPERAKATDAKLTELGYTHEFHLFPSHGHEYHAEQYLKLTLDFFDRYSKK
ncbi:MAG: prolyl oligopeptidase family serine peptidase [Planctomycetes bacterium]|nr:prolyl oligopeptidase family serine peptidase [Planctomycetota bacterium]